MMEYRGSVKLGRLSGEDLYLSSWWSRLDTKLAVSGGIYLVSDMSTDENRELRPNTFGMHFPSCIYLELFCFALILKCGGSHITGLG